MDALAGLKILDLSRLLPGPFCTMLLGDFGAEVIKVEEPDRGDYARSFPPFQNGFGYWHLQLNRNKKSVVLDLKTEQGREKFLQLAADADAVVESYRPGVLQKLGIDYQVVNKINPKIVYCSLSGYGKTGPLAKQADHDLGYVSLAGITAMSGEKQGKPAIPGVLMADMNSALYAGMALLIALRHAQKTGQGQEIEIALYNSAMTLMPGAASLFFGSGFVPERGNNWLTGANANYNVYACKDGRYVSVGCLETKFWNNLCSALEREDLKDQCENQERHSYLQQELTKEFAKRTMREWEAYLYGKDTCVTPVLTYGEAAAEPQTLANEMVLKVWDEEAGEYTVPGFAMKLSKTPAKIRHRAPKLGENNKEFGLE